MQLYSYFLRVRGVARRRRGTPGGVYLGPSFASPAPFADTSTMGVNGVTWRQLSSLPLPASTSMCVWREWGARLHVQGHMEPSKSLRPSWAVFPMRKSWRIFVDRSLRSLFWSLRGLPWVLCEVTCLSDWGGAVVCSEGCDGNVGVAAVRCVLLHRGQVCPLLEADRHRFRHHGVDFFRNAGQPINLFDYEPNHGHRHEPATTLVSMTARS